MVFRHDRGHDGHARCNAAMLPAVMLPTWAGMVMLSATADEDASAEAS